MTLSNNTIFLMAAVFSLVASTAHGVVGASSPFSKGDRLAQAVYSRATGSDASSEVLMLLLKKGKKPEQRTLYSYVKDKGDAERWTLLRFVKPSEVAKVGLLTKDYSGEKSDQWIYLPALDRVRRISSSRKGGRFVGSDFQYEDLMDREVDMDSHNILGEDNVAGIKCILLESIPLSKSSSIYSKRVSCIHLGLKIPLRIDYYVKKHDDPVKRLRAKKIKKIQGFWTIFDSTMYNLRTGSSTKLKTINIKYNQGIPDTFFNQQGLSDDTRAIPFRP